jgi:hypothetical protein
MEFKLSCYRCSGRLAVANLHAADEAILYQVHVLHPLIDEEFAAEIANDLMDVNGGAAIGFGGEIGGFDVRVEDRPLASPVVANLCVTAGATVFHQVGPVYVAMHEVEHGVDVACVEVLIRGGEKFSVSLHGLLLLDH